MDLTKIVTFKKPAPDGILPEEASPDQPVAVATILSTSVPAGTYHKGERMLMLREDVIAELSLLLGRNITNTDDLLLAAHNVTTLNIKGLTGADITLEPYLLHRLRSRCHPTQDFPEFVRARVIELLMGYCGA